MTPCASDGIISMKEHPFLRSIFTLLYSRQLCSAGLSVPLLERFIKLKEVSQHQQFGILDPI